MLISIRLLNGILCIFLNILLADITLHSELRLRSLVNAYTAHLRSVGHPVLGSTSPKIVFLSHPTLASSNDIFSKRDWIGEDQPDPSIASIPPDVTPDILYGSAL